MIRKRDSKDIWNQIQRYIHKLKKERKNPTKKKKLRFQQVKTKFYKQKEKVSSMVKLFPFSYFQIKKETLFPIKDVQHFIFSKCCIFF